MDRRQEIANPTPPDPPPLDQALQQNELGIKFFLVVFVPSDNRAPHYFMLRTLLIVATNFSVLVAYWIWLVLILAIFE